ncbi:MAG: rRNA maturation RNase YbeY [Gammaproteobacteria bacterium]|nr:rRNA maturation RNase YbeY [Gammaproteobacteria bacterium]
MSVRIEIERAQDIGDAVPGDAALKGWLREALVGIEADVELGVRIVGEDEGRRFNRDYRGSDYATNVLSFRADKLPDLSPRPIGDLLFCAPVVAREAEEQGKPANAHWAHLCIHGVLHLLGHDHEVEEEARLMEGLEVEILARLGYQDPYRAGARGN